MLHSMTGYGSSKHEDASFRVIVEIRTLNSKFLDLQLRIPRTLGSLEPEIRSVISKKLVRGKASVNIDLEDLSNDPDANLVNRQLFSAYFREFKELAREHGQDAGDAFSLALSQPEVMRSTDSEEASEELSMIVLDELGKALNTCCEFRVNEGRNLEAELHDYIAKIGQYREEVIELEKQRSAKIRERLKAGLSQFMDQEGIDQNRMEQELIFYLEKLDITEELVRLESHINYFNEVLKEDNCGKKLGFLSQELGREINTIGSKANDASIQQIVVRMKEELEKIKEQSLNVL